MAQAIQPITYNSTAAGTKQKHNAHYLFFKVVFEVDQAGSRRLLSRLFVALSLFSLAVARTADGEAFKAPHAAGCTKDRMFTFFKATHFSSQTDSVHCFFQMQTDFCFIICITLMSNTSHFCFSLPTPYKSNQSPFFSPRRHLW